MKALGEASWNMRYVAEDEQVEFIVTMKQEDAWFGLALGGEGSMAYGTDMVVFFAMSETSDFGDYNSAGYGEPNVDTQNDIKLHPDGSIEVDEAATQVTLFARRALDTGDGLSDFVIPLDTEFNIGYAYNDYISQLSPYTPHELQD